MDFSKLTEVKPKLTFASKRQPNPKRYIIGIDPINSSRSNYGIHVWVVKDGHVVTSFPDVKHSRVRKVLEKIFKDFNRRSCKIIRNFKP